MTLIYENDLSDPRDLFLRDGTAEVAEWQGHRALRLNGLVVIPAVSLTEGHIEVEIGADGAAYPGIAFRVADMANYELAYAQPHTSGLWDAIQYDPVFHGSNTWQLYHGQMYQRMAPVPMSTWFTFSVDFKDERALIFANDYPLLINDLAHTHQYGMIGLWTFLPAYFCNLRVASLEHEPLWSTLVHRIDSGNVTAWFVEGFGVVTCEPTGILNLNRYLPVALGEVRLTRSIDVLAAGSIDLDVGFSDELTLQIDDEVIFTGHHLFQGMSNDWATRGYVVPTTHLQHTVAPGRHRLTATLKATEYFGWGLIINLHGDNFKLLPASLG
jgi:hypothetical protein